MLDEPDLVARGSRALGRERLHLDPDVRQRPESQIPNERRFHVTLQSAIRTCELATRSW
jgi:hypothetical protein